MHRLGFPFFLLLVGALTLVTTTRGGAEEQDSAQTLATISQDQDALRIQRRKLAVGGGFTLAGLSGQYFGNPSFNGTPLFTRNDVRLDFRTAGPWGGSTSAAYASLPNVNFSVRWTGQLVAAFSEKFTFTIAATDDARLFLRPAGTASFTKVVDTAGAGGTASGTFDLTAGATYDVMVEYSCVTVPAKLVLSWASKSTPSEIIEPLRQVGLNVGFAASLDGAHIRYADAVKSGRPHWVVDGSDNPVPADANGWPLTDANLMIWEGIGGDGSLDGTYSLTFTGQATINTFDGPKVVGTPAYNSATNTTSATLVNKATTGNQNFIIILKNTRRTPASAVNTGVTNVRLMRPVSPGATTSLSPSTVFTPTFAAAAAPYTVLRFMASANGNMSVNWADRTTPTFFTQFGPEVAGEMWEGHGEAWEYRIMLANELGKDLYINIPQMATGSDPADTASYVYRLAALIKNGGTFAGVKYPKLNPNLKVYVEYSNEVWNFGFPQWKQNFDAAKAAVEGNTPDGKIIAYDGTTDVNLFWHRRYALRVKQTSDIFRAVFGDAAMGDRVRMLLEYQYDNAGWPPTAQTMLGFIDTYYNNADGKAHVEEPHPVNYFVWGGGGATYYNANQPDAPSVDALFASGIPETGYPGMLQRETHWSARYGLVQVAYEGGWALGGDGGGNAVQNQAKFTDPRTRDAQNRTFQIFDQAGGGITVLGTYGQWKTIGTVASSPLWQAVGDASRTLPALPTNGAALPQSLSPANATLKDTSWMSWNVVAPVTAMYTITPKSSTNAALTIAVDGVGVWTGAGNAPPAIKVRLTRGLHSVQASVPGATLVPVTLTVSLPGAPSGLVAVAGSGAVGLSWSAPAEGAAPGYFVYRGTSSGGQGTTPLNGTAISGTSYIDATAVNGTTYFYTVKTSVAGGPSSNEASATPQAVVPLASYSTYGNPGGEPTVKPSTAPLVTATDMVRGGGLKPENSFLHGFGSTPIDNVYAKDLAAAITKNHYSQVTLAPSAGKTLALSSIAVRGWTQDSVAGCTMVIRYSTDGTTFTTLATTSLASTNPWSPATADVNLSGIAALQAVTGGTVVTFRAYIYGALNYRSSGIGGSTAPALVVTGSTK